MGKGGDGGREKLNVSVLCLGCVGGERGRWLVCVCERGGWGQGEGN